jgi:hypothetical protein
MIRRQGDNNRSNQMGLTIDKKADPNYKESFVS